ncbi:hypothetical protein MMC17_006836 [Xylographa soralifera]|nr:hypothetical protein [Xylographa soralifera]
MVFGFNRRANASNVSPKAPLVAEPRRSDEIDRSHLEHFVAPTSFTIEEGRRKEVLGPELFDKPRSILLEMIESDLPTLLALRITSKTMGSFVELKVKQHLQEKFETFEIVYPLQIRQGPNILTFGEGLNWIGEHVKKLNVTVIPRHTEPNRFQTVRDIELKKSYWHMVAQNELFTKNIAASDYGTSFETILRSLPFLKHIEIILAPPPSTVLDHKGLQINTSLYSSETWHWCPLFDEGPAPGNEIGKSAVSHFLPLLDIRLSLDIWRPDKLKEVTLTNLTFAGLLALNHDALWKMRVTKDSVPTDPMNPVQPFWRSLKAVNIRMIAFWHPKDMPIDHCVGAGSEAYKLGMTILSEWLDTINCQKLTWLMPTLTAEKSEMDVASPGTFVRVKGPGRFRLFWWM